jgi:hypothetical protein
MAWIDNETLQRLARELAEPQRLQDAAGLAGAGLQVPMAGLRARAARRELARIEARDGARSPAAKRQAALVAALDTRAAEAAATYARRSIEPPALSKEEAGLVGRVTRDCVPLAGVTLMALDPQNQPLRQTCTGRDGRYALALPGGVEVRLEAREDGKPFWRDDESFAYPAGFRGQRDIETGAATPICNPTGTTAGGTVQMPDLVGLDVGRAVRSIEALGLTLERVEETPSETAGIVLSQRPKAGAAVDRGALVALQAGARDDRPAARVGDLAGRRLSDGLARMAEAEVAPASITLVPGTQAAAVIRASRATAAGDAMHLSVAVPEGEAAKVEVAAALLASGEEGRAIGLDSPEAAVKWLRTAKIASLADAAAAAGEDDATLRKRLALEPRASVVPQRRALLSLATRLRDG